MDKQVEIYETRFPDWLSQWDNLLTANIFVSENAADFDVLSKKYRYLHDTEEVHDFSAESMAKLKKDATKLVVVQGDNRRKLDLIKKTFPELASWRPNAKTDFTYATMLSDKRVLIVVNLVSSTFEKQLETRLELH